VKRGTEMKKLALVVLLVVLAVPAWSAEAPASPFAVELAIDPPVAEQASAPGRLALAGAGSAQGATWAQVAIGTAGPKRETRLLSRESLLLGSALVLSSVADVETTMAFQRRGFTEQNQVLAPLAGSRLALYSVKAAVTAGALVWSHKMRRSPKRRNKVLGWAVPVAVIAAQSFVAAHNARLGR